ncbi:MAG: hypothetical protein KKD01_15620 [Proteobacteria bacterium]|nr:hypothetical protein [Pseudomonadota bacterium]MBU1417662.1 hypothetical protein [Pseudomonadota bacterium]MBU1456153.1 hypothetical protein [Pseudomonadota bacterium]
MTTTTQTTARTQVDIGYETSHFALGVGIVMAAFVGLWGAACIASALLSTGPVGLMQSCLSAMIG